MNNIIKKAISEAKKYKKINCDSPNVIKYTIHNETLTTNIIGKNNVRHNTILQFVKNTCKDSNLNISFYICLDDHTIENIPILTFSSKLSSNILMPDLYAILKYQNKLSKDDILYENKDKKALFIGCTTGNLDAKLNNRLKICNKYRKNEVIHCYIHKICQMSYESVHDAYPYYNDFLSPTKQFNEMCKYKYIISVEGNSAAWDRIPMFLNSNSILLIQNSDHKCWYYDFLIPNVHYIPFDDDTDLEKIVSSDEDRRHIIKNANQFVTDYLTYDKHLLYMKTLLETMNTIK